MTTTVFNVANHILQGKKNYDLLQLIKLCYLSYGWYLAYYDKPLFDEKVEAWKYGPVIPELYFSLKHFRGKELPRNCLKNLAVKDKEFSSDAKQLVDAVADFYGQYTGIQLSALTHKKDSPWYKTYKGLGKTWGEIPDGVIKEHFDKLKSNIKN